MNLVINADDFGRSHEINQAVIRAHCEGVLTSASLMVAGEAVEEAVDLARRHPMLRVGLHVVAVDGPAVLPHDQIPLLTDESGHFPDAPVRLGLRYVFSRSARAQLAHELEAQFERFAATGLTLSHVDGHQHMHMHPVVFDLLLPLARRFNAGRVRVVRDDLRLALRHDRRHALSKLVAAAIFAGLAHRRDRKLRIANGLSLPRTYGFFQSGAMDEAYVSAVLRQIDRDAELYFHPTQGPRLDPLGPNPTDLATLLSPAVRSIVQAQQLQLNYRDDAGQRCDRANAESAPPAAGPENRAVTAP